MSQDDELCRCIRQRLLSSLHAAPSSHVRDLAAAWQQSISDALLLQSAAASVMISTASAARQTPYASLNMFNSHAWNALPSSVRVASSLQAFRWAVKTTLFQAAFTDTDSVLS